MLDPMLTLIVAKAKAVGLVAGTAMLTTALVGGGAVAMTAVSHEGEPDAPATAPLLLEDEATTSDTPTVVIDDDEAEDAPEVEEVEEVETEDAEGKVRPPLPAGFVCDDSKNHGQNVSAYAKSLPKGEGRGELVSAVAQSDCGKKAKDEAADAEPAEESVETESAETEVEDAEPKPDKAAKAEKKAAKKSGKAAKKSGKK